MALRADVTSEEDVQRLFAGAVERFGTTGLVNNAGLTAYIGDLADTAEVIRRVIDVNLLGVVLCARQATRSWRGGVVDTAEPSSTSLPRPQRSGPPMSTFTTQQPRQASMRLPWASHANWPETTCASTPSRLALSARASTLPPVTPGVPTGSLNVSRLVGRRTQKR